VNTVASPRLDHRQTALKALWLAMLVLVGWQYFGTYSSIVRKWMDDAAFSHGFLILPISLWLAWRKRAELSAVTYRPSMIGAVLVLLCTLAWIVARGTGVLVLEQFAAVALVPALMLAVLGRQAVRVLAVPLGFLFFMVPFGRALVPFLMQITADFATILLQWSHVPVLRTYMYITIPGGWFEVARACSGLNYFTTSLVLGCLYAYLNYRGWLKRTTCVLAFVIIPIILNGLRVYITILVSHLTNMRFGPGTEHMTFGKIFFVIMMGVLFWVGRRWHDEPDASSATPAAPTRSASGLHWWPLAVATLVALSGPAFVAVSIAGAASNLSSHGSGLVAMPPTAQGWEGPADGKGRWRPLYRGGLIERQSVYHLIDGAPVDVFVAVYGLGKTVGAEMINYSNVVTDRERKSLTQDSTRAVLISSGQSLDVRELVVFADGGSRLVWQWFVVGDRPVVGPFATKAFEALAFVTRTAESERIVTVSTPQDADAETRLQKFMTAYGQCAATGFAAEHCDR
jgi:eight transmembrane protein EpsH (proposed exosortase)